MNAIQLANYIGSCSLLDVAKELNISKSTLVAWLKNHREQLNHYRAAKMITSIAVCADFKGNIQSVD